MKSTKIRNGFALVEILIVIGIIGFAMVSLLVLLTMGVETNRVSAEESGAVNLASSLLGDLRNSPIRDSSGNLRKTSVKFSLPMPLSVEQESTVPPLILTSDATVADSGSETRYLVEATYVPAGFHLTPPDLRPAYVSLKISWPAQAANASTLQGRWECVAAFPGEGAEWR